jgi:hypothetical protein
VALRGEGTRRPSEQIAPTRSNPASWERRTTATCGGLVGAYASGVTVAVNLVRCINCSAGTSWPTVVALVFSGVGVLTAARGLFIQSIEQRRLRRELAKRADLSITIRPLGHAFTNVTTDSADLALNASVVILRFEIGISNVGQKAATHTSLNVLAPARYSGLKWCGPNGEELDVRRDAPLTSEQLPGAADPNGSRWLTEEIQRVALRTPRLRWVLFGVDLPPDGQIDVPVRAKAQSDDLPDDVHERVKDFVVHLRRG